MEMIVYINSSYTGDVNAMLREGWKVKFIIPFFENVSSGSIGNRGNYGAYAVLEK